MSEAIIFALDLVPLKRRHQHVKGKEKGRGDTYAHPKTVAEEAAVAFRARQAMGGRPLARGGVTLVLIHRHAGGSMPDLDNVLKAVKDALNQIVYLDDKQIDVIHAKRVLVPKGRGGIVAKLSWNT